MKYLLKENKNNIIIAAVIIAALTAAFFLGGRTSDNTVTPSEPSQSVSDESSIAESAVADDYSSALSEHQKNPNPDHASQSSEKSQTPRSDSASTERSIRHASSTEDVSDDSKQSSGAEGLMEETSEAIEPNASHDVKSYETSVNHSESTKTESVKLQPEKHTSLKPESKTESSLSGKPITSSVSDTVSKEISDNTEEKHICSLSINCSTAVNYSGLNAKIRSLLPTDGNIFLSSDIKFAEGESVFDILDRVCRENGIRMISSLIPLSGGRYIERINDLGEFDCGNLSGWMVSVNGEFIMVSCSEYKVAEGDQIAFLYTCNLGDDIGNHYYG